MLDHMKQIKVAIIDYGAGNMLSVKRAVEACGAIGICTADPVIIEKADRIILPGVGAFSIAMNALNKLKLVEFIQKMASNGKPLLGICLGMQLLFDESEEFGLTPGLKILPGRIVKIPIARKNGKLLKIPHIGWNRLESYSGVSWENTILEANSLGDEFYFVHSFIAEASNRSHVLAYTKYEDIEINAVVRSDNVMGCQFHPEKSGTLGIKVLSQFVSHG
jgi:imidazole glycerol-phosphate synthase subunit HisH